MATVSTKENHDSLWVKAELPGKAWIKFKITRSTISISSNMDINTLPAKAFKEKADEIYGNNEMKQFLTYGEMIKLIAVEWGKL